MAERLFELLPAVLRTRDAEQGQPLRALMAVLEQQLDAVTADTDTAWDNWFIETCEEWLVPYIGEQLGVRGMRSIEATGFSQRAFVANALRYRRRKGTAAVVEQLARDVTGYAAHVVEFFKHTIVSAHMQHLREAGTQPACGGTIDLRSATHLDRLGTAFDQQAHTADVRHIASGRGRTNLPHLGIFLWRVQSQELSAGTAAPIAGTTGWYRFHPLGWDAPLYNLPVSETEIEALATEVNVPHALSRRSLFDQLRGELPNVDLSDDPAIVVRTETSGVLSAPWTLEICDLSDVSGALPTKRPARGVVAVDPELGRLTFNPADIPSTGPFEVLVDYSAGSVGELGAGPFDRSDAHEEQRDGDAFTFVRAVSRDPARVGSGVVPTLGQAVADWQAYQSTLSADDLATAVGAIVVLDSRTYAAPADPISIAAGARLHLIGAGISGALASAITAPSTLSLVADRTRPVIKGDLTVRGTEIAGSRARTGGLFLNGLTLSGQIVVVAGDLERLDLAHLTVAPPSGTPSVVVRSAAGLTNATLAVRAYRCLLGALAAEGPLSSLSAADSLVDGPMNLVGTAVTLEAVSVFGNVRARTLSASNTVFAAAVTVEQHQEGCLRFCYAAPGERTPRRYRCLPDLVLAGVTDATERARILARVRPAWVTREPAGPAYPQLSGSPEFLTAAEDGAELGAGHFLAQELRIANLRAALRQYLRFGLEAGVVLES